MEKTKKTEELPIVKSGTVRLKHKWENLTRRDKKNLQKKGDKAFLVKMFFSNGTCKEFVIVTEEEIFTYKKRSYYLRYEDSWFNLTQNQYELHYFDDYGVPIDRAVKQDGDKRYWVVKSENLKPLFDMQYVKILAQSQDLDKYLRMGATLGAVNLLFGMVTLLLVIKIMRGLP